MFILQITANSPYPEISNFRKFIHHKSISSFVHFTFIMPVIKEVKHSTKTASSDSKSEDLHDDPIYMVRTLKKSYNSFKERMEILSLNQVILII